MQSLSFLLVAGIALSIPAYADQSIVERGPNHNIVQAIDSIEQDGQTITRTNYFTQLGSGLNFWDGQTWAESTDEIEILDTGAAYRKGPYQLFFASNINDPKGTLQWFPGPDQAVALQTIGLAVTEESTGDSIWIGQVKDAQGFLTAPNEITYPSCFDQIDASVRVRVRHYGFENDVVLHERIPDTGFQGASRLEVWHRIVSAAAPMLNPSGVLRNSQKTDADTWLGFGPMVIGPGTAFLIGANQDELSGAAGEKIPVAKEFFVDPQSGAKFLIESVPLDAAAAHLKTLPATTHALNLSPKIKERLQASRLRGSGRRQPVSGWDGERKEPKAIAAISRQPLPNRSGLLLDFSTLVTQTNQVFAGDTTYLIASNSVVNLSGNTVIEAGTVVKFGQTDPGNSTPIIHILGTLDCQTRPYAPAIFTSREDRTAGETNTATVASVNTNVSYGASHLFFESTNVNSFVLHDVHTRYANKALKFAGTNSVDIWNLQAYGTFSSVIESSGFTNTLRNVLANKVNDVVAPTANNVGFKGEHFTIHSASRAFNVGAQTGCSFNLTNSLIVLATNTSSGGFTTAFSHTLTDETGVFQTVGSGAHYLSDYSPYRNSGSTNVSAAVSLLTYSTTYPPVSVTGTISVPTTLGLQAQRDTDVPDEGYHYPAIDWAFGGASVTSTLILTNGAAAAVYTASGLNLQTGSKLICEGGPLTMAHLVRYNTVQEQPAFWGTATSGAMIVVGSADVAQVKLRFTEIDHLANTASLNALLGYNGSSFDVPTDFTMRDCELYSSRLLTSQNTSPGTIPVVGLTNNLFVRSTLEIDQVSGDNMTAYLRNNLFWRSALNFDFHNSDDWQANNNLFDNCTIYNPTFAISSSYNGYINTSAFSGGSNDKTIASGDYQIGPLGRFYYPASGTNLSTLVNAGSTTAAAASLYHYTTQVSESPEGGTQLDIGYHYLSTACQPLDTYWFDDALPTTNTIVYPSTDVWTWTVTNPGHYSAQKALRSPLTSGYHLIYFEDANPTMSVGTGASVFAYVYLDTTNAPRSIMLQWYDGSSWNHRAYWGENLIYPGLSEGSANHHVGDLPSAGQWARLEVPASQVALEGTTLRGISYTMFDGRATWDAPGKSEGTHCLDSDGDGIPDYLEDLDGDGIVDSGEGEYRISVKITSPSGSTSLP